MTIRERVAAPSCLVPVEPAGGGLEMLCFPLPFPQRLEPKGGTEGSLWYLCNMTGNVMPKSRDSLRVVSASANCTRRENRGEEACSLTLVTSW